LYPQIQPGLFPTVEQHFLFKSCAIKLSIPEPGAVYQWFSTLKEKEHIAESTYWSRLWPAAIGLCYFMDNNLALIKNKKILELGAGLGLPSLFAGFFTDVVFCTDIHPNAISWAKNAASINGLPHVQHSIADWNKLPHELMDVEVVLLSDGNYNPKDFDQLFQLIHDFLEQGTQVILCTPQRLSAKPFVSSLLPKCQKQEQFEIRLKGNTVEVSALHLAG
jgi:predicted nicotinamide N-methyase